MTMTNRAMASLAMRHREEDKAEGRPPWQGVSFVMPPEMKEWVVTASTLLGWTQGKFLRRLVTFGWAEPGKVFSEEEADMLSTTAPPPEPVEKPVKKEPRPKSEYQQRRDRFPWLEPGADLTGGDDE